MYVGAISMRYSKALLAFANEGNVSNVVYMEALILEQSFKEVLELRHAMENPILTQENKMNLLITASGGKISKQMERFFQLVMKEKREKFLPSIMRSYIDLYRKQENISVGNLITAVPMAPKEVERIRRIIVDHKGGSAEFSTKVDPSIQGGFIFEIGTYRLDASIANQIRKVKQQFIEKNRRIV